jgi:hypothetical protein
VGRKSRSLPGLAGSARVNQLISDDRDPAFFANICAAVSSWLTLGAAPRLIAVWHCRAIRRIGDAHAGFPRCACQLALARFSLAAAVFGTCGPADCLLARDARRSPPEATCDRLLLLRPTPAGIDGGDQASARIDPIATYTVCQTAPPAGRE